MDIELRKIKDEDGIRELIARFKENGDIVFDGWDLGKGVEKCLGSREYEWTWTIKAVDVPILERALDSDLPLAEAVQQRFAGDRAGEVLDFLESKNIPFESWHRIGD